MGYTHYWRRYREFTMGEWNRICQRATRAIEASKLESPHIRDVEIDKERIFFNGGCETFVLTREVPPRPDYWPKEEWEKTNGNGKGVFDCCKTRQAPYDSVVVDILKSAFLASGSDAITLASDGGVFEEYMEEQ